MESSALNRPLRICSRIRLVKAPPKLRGSFTTRRYIASARSWSRFCPYTTPALLIALVLMESRRIASS